MIKPRKATAAQEAEVRRAVEAAKHPRSACPVNEDEGCPFCVPAGGTRSAVEPTGDGV